ncbi:IPT/TIG domain-containing protein [Caulobacter mirabilis]|uniref:IPT/TIG domain-containing protein n=1 Tax=Caulobacter mirabilis TaxID=69666 RepID=A0A2D2B0B2_9CAUL|nr:IPT/TIG domain-containing protein [Caulobacter mirabilis]ATQ43698.1 hypothetical protein CSW64_15505 [Caulobacter mirabilis]
MVSVALRGFARRAGSRAAWISPLKAVGLAFAWCAALLVGALGATPTPAWAQYGQGAPEITSVSPSAGRVAGGETVTITGVNLRPIPGPGITVRFGGTQVMTLREDPTFIEVRTPPGVAGTTVDVVVTTSYGSTPVTAASKFSYAAAPVITSVNPGYGLHSETRQVVLTGQNFTGARGVSFAGWGVPFTVDSDGQITLTTRPVAQGVSADIIVTGASGETARTIYRATGPAKVTTATIYRGPAGSEITYTGVGFTGMTSVTIGGVAASFSVTSDTELKVTVPGGLVSGSHPVAMTTPMGTATAASFYVLGAPIVSSIGFNESAPEGGNMLTINGVGFAQPLTVKFGEVASPNAIFYREDFIVAAVPPGVGQQQVTVTTPHGVSATGPATAFTYVSEPRVNSLGLSRGPSTGGDEIEIYGYNLGGATAVQFGSASATFVVVSSSRILAVTPRGPESSTSS